MNSDGICQHCRQWRHDHEDDKCLFAETRYEEDVDATFESYY